MKNFLTDDQIDFLNNVISTNSRTSDFVERQDEPWRLRYDHSVDVYGDVNLAKRQRIPYGLQIGTVYGNFYSSYNPADDMQGAPRIVNGTFVWINGNITTLKGGPTKVTGNYNVTNNQLVSLIGIADMPKTYNLSCDLNPVSMKTFHTIHKRMIYDKKSWTEALESLATTLPYEDLEKIDHTGIDEKLWNLILRYANIRNF